MNASPDIEQSVQPQSFFTYPLDKRFPESLAVWLNRSRVPAIFKEQSDLVPWNPGACRERLRFFTETWITARYRLDGWTGRELLEQTTHFATLSLAQSIYRPVSTSITWGPHVPDDALTGVSDGQQYEPPLSPDLAAQGADRAAAEEEERDERQRELEEYVGHQKAALIFLAFITSSFFNRIGRCARCSKFFFNKSGHRNKQFCSTRCAHITSALESKKREFEKKLARLRHALSRLSAQGAKARDWKERLASRARVTRHFVTRALNQGLIELRRD